MICNLQLPNSNTSTCSKESGAALVVFAIIVLAISIATFIFSNNNTIDKKILSSMKTQNVLAQAKRTLEQLSLSFIPATTLGRNEIGRLPFPDNINDGVYDGFADCLNYSSSLTNPDLYLGKFPWLGTQNCSPAININSDFVDANGDRLWYAVSPYMVDNINNAGFNPAYLIDSPSLPDWLSIYGSDGTLISDRVAFIVFSAGQPLSGQNRLNTNVGNFLDAFNVPGLGVVNNFDDDMVYVKAPATETFNDSLIYMTIDELMPKLEKRVLSELRNLLVIYQGSGATPFYPLPASLGGTDCDISLQNGGGGFIATTDAASTPCNQPLLSVPSYLSAWIPYVIYEPRRDCNQFNQAGCNNAPAGLVINAESDKDFTLISTGFNAPVNPANRAEYLQEPMNQLNDQNFVTPVLTYSIFQDQLIYR